MYDVFRIKKVNNKELHRVCGLKFYPLLPQTVCLYHCIKTLYIASIYVTISAELQPDTEMTEFYTAETFSDH